MTTGQILQPLEMEKIISLKKSGPVKAAKYDNCLASGQGSH